MKFYKNALLIGLLSMASICKAGSSLPPAIEPDTFAGAASTDVGAGYWFQTNLLNNVLPDLMLEACLQLDGPEGRNGPQGRIRIYRSERCMSKIANDGFWLSNSYLDHESLSDLEVEACLMGPTQGPNTGVSVFASDRCIPIVRKILTKHDSGGLERADGSPQESSLRVVAKSLAGVLDGSSDSIRNASSSNVAAF